LLATVGLPDLAEHLEHRIGQRQYTFFISLADDPQNHLLRIDRRDPQSNRLVDPQSIGINERETAAIDRVFQTGDQLAAVVVGTDVGQPLAAGLADFFFVNRAQSVPNVLR